MDFRRYKTIFLIWLVFGPLIYISLVKSEFRGFSPSILNNIIGNSATKDLTSSSVADMTNDPPNTEGITQRTNITFQLTYNWTLWTDFLISTQVRHWFARILNHTHPYYSGCAPIQESELLFNDSNYNVFSNPVNIHDPADDYNNSYDYFSNHLKNSDHPPKFYYNATYNVTLRETIWNIDPSKIGEYNAADPLYINYTGAENMLEVGDSDLITLSNQICTGKTTIVDKAEAIYKWMVNKANLNYAAQASEKSAKQMYTDRVGDCSEFANLMVTLLRIQGIPARKVVGLTIMTGSDSEGWKMIGTPTKGTTYTYYQNFRWGSTTGILLPGHAWIEYYIPNYGWVACDPTWGYSGGDYFNRIDYVHIFWNTGENFGGGMNPLLPGPSTEIAILPSLWSTDFNKIAFDLSITIRILDCEIYYNNNLWMFVGIVVIISAISIILYIFMASKRKKSSKTYF